MTTDLYLIRHGQALSAVQRTIGNTDLSALGVQQAEHLRDRLAATREIAADVLISSTLLRARQTAQIIAPALNLPIILDDEVQEMREGEAMGMTVEDYRAKYGRVDFDMNPFQPISPGGENWSQFTLRMGAALHRITHEHEGKTIVVVCHGGIIDGSFLYFFGLSTLTLPHVRLNTHNTSITNWRKMDSYEDRVPRWHLCRYNDTLHIRDIGLPNPIPWGEIFAHPATGADQPNIPLFE